MVQSGNLNTTALSYLAEFEEANDFADRSSRPGDLGLALSSRPHDDLYLDSISIMEVETGPSIDRFPVEDHRELLRSLGHGVIDVEVVPLSRGSALLAAYVQSSERLDGTFLPVLTVDLLFDVEGTRFSITVGTSNEDAEAAIRLASQVAESISLSNEGP